MSVKNIDPKYDGLSDYYHMRLRQYIDRGKMFHEAIKLAQGDVSKWLKGKNKGITNPLEETVEKMITKVTKGEE